MSKSISKLDQAIRDLLEAYSELDDELEAKFPEDEDAFSNAMIEAFEASIEGALEDQETSSAALANVIACMSEALEQIDPSAFEDEEGEEFESDDDDYEIDETEDLDEDEEEGDK